MLFSISTSILLFSATILAIIESTSSAYWIVSGIRLFIPTLAILGLKVPVELLDSFSISLSHVPRISITAISRSLFVELFVECTVIFSWICVFAQYICLILIFHWDRNLQLDCCRYSKHIFILDYYKIPEGLFKS